MGFTPTDVDWADVTWPVIIGCHRVGPGCDNCWAILSAHVRAGNPHPAVGPKYEGLTLRSEGRTDWAGVVRTFPDQLPAAFRARKPKRVFVASQGDVFHDQVPDEFLARLFAVMALAHWHTFTVLTKRHGRMRSLLNSPTFVRLVAAAAAEVAREHDVPAGHLAGMLAGEYWPLPNLELVVSVEDQHWAEIRIPALLETPAAVRGISAEPLLGPIDLTRISAARPSQPEMVFDVAGRRYGVPGRWQAPLSAGLDWVIAGGESGPKARPMHPAWVRALRDQCAAAGVPFFFKQWGEWGPAPWVVRVCDPAEGWRGTDAELAAAKKDAEARGATHVHTGNRFIQDGEWVWSVHKSDHKSWSLERADPLPCGMEAIRRWGKGRAGHVLDGREHREYPRPRVFAA